MRCCEAIAALLSFALRCTGLTTNPTCDLASAISGSVSSIGLFFASAMSLGFWTSAFGAVLDFGW